MALPGRAAATVRSSPNQSPRASRQHHIQQSTAGHPSNGRPDFARMSPAERLAYHRERLGLGADSKRRARLC